MNEYLESGSETLKMHQLPHTYSVSATAETESIVSLSAPGVTTISSAAPVEFDGPGDQWSPESLLVAAVADCFVLSFRGIARASRLDWSELDCHVDGILDRVDRGLQFTRFKIRASLTIPSEDNRAKAEKLLHKAEQSCLVTNSLIGERHLEAEVLISN
jgi:organic hydroperoxide reductase OsmC/OhrA